MFELLAHWFTPRHTNNHRPKILHPEGFFVLATLVVVFGILLKTTPQLSHLGSVLGYSSSITPDEVLTSINVERNKAGLGSLTVNDQLNAAAQAKATNMFQDQYWAHNSPTGITPWVFIKSAGYKYNVAGENLARDFGDTATMVSAWMASPTHKDNIVNEKYKETGIAVVNGELEGVETTLVVQMFGAPSTGTPAVSKTSDTTVFAAGVQTSEVPPPVGSELTAQQASVMAAASPHPFISPIQLNKAISLTIIFLLILVLCHDMFIAHKKKTVRLTGKNLAHIALFVVIAIVIVLFRGGVLS